MARRANYKSWGFGAIAIGSFASVVDHGSVNIALPSIATHFDTNLPTVQWIVIGYALTITALLLPMGRLADLLGRKEVYIAGSALFVLGAFLAGVANHLEVLVLARIIQGVGAAMSQGTGMAIVAAMFPVGERGKAIGLIMTVVGTGAVAGPAVGGLLVDALGWRSVFFFNVPLGTLGVLASIAVLAGRSSQPATPDTQRQSFDWWGASLSAGALVLFLLAITNLPNFGLISPPILGGLGGFAVLLGSFIWWELRYPSPLLDVRLFQRKTFSFGAAAALLIFLGSSAVMFLMPFYLQIVLDFSPLKAGLVVVPGALCMAVLGPLSGMLSDRYGWRKFTVGGLVLSVIGLFMLTWLTEGSSLLLVMPALIMTSSGMGVFYSPNTSSILSAVEQEKFGVVSAFLNLVRNGANVTSIAMAAAIATTTMASMGYEPSLAAVTGGGATHAFTLGMSRAYVVMTGLLITGMVVSAFKFEQK